MGAALASCAQGTAATDTVTIYVPGTGRLPGPPDNGYIILSVGGQKACGYSYDTTYDTAATIAQGLVGDCLSSPYFTPTYEGGGTVLLTTKAKGPYTNYSAAAQVVDQCYSGCGSPPVVDLSSQFTGGQP